MLNYCFQFGSGYHSIVYYSHIVPTALALFLSIYALVKTRFSKLSLTFFLFTLTFSLWLLGDIFTWTFHNTYWSVFIWSWLDYINVVFFALGAYFFAVLARGKITSVETVAFIGLCVPAFLLTLQGDSITEFYQPVCEVLENNQITNYKLIAEAVVVALMVLSLIVAWKKSDRQKKSQLLVVFLAIMLFFGVFSSTEYIATITDTYEINLYGLFVLPLFLIAMVYSVTNLKIFQIRFLGTQLLVYILILLIASQFLFLQGSTDRTLNLLTLVLSALFGYLLLDNAKKGEAARLRIEQLAGQLQKSNSDLEHANARLKELDQLKTEFVSLATHQIRAPLTSIKGYVSLVREGDYGPVSKEVKDALDVVFQSTNNLVTIVGDFLDVSRIEQGRMKYDYSDFDANELVNEIVTEYKPVIDTKGLKITYMSDAGKSYLIHADKGKIKQVIGNILDNSIKYTPKGSITVRLAQKAGKNLISVSDTGVGISKDTLPKLFQKFSRADDAGKTNILGTGLGLYVAKSMVESMGGRVWAESEGEGKGAQFYIELPVKA